MTLFTNTLQRELVKLFIIKLAPFLSNNYLQFIPAYHKGTRPATDGCLRARAATSKALGEAGDKSRPGTVEERFFCWRTKSQ